MRFKQKHKDALAYYGLSHLLDATIAVFVDEDNVLHIVGGCMATMDDYGDEINYDKSHLLDIKIKDIKQPCCYCLQSEPAVGKARSLVDCFIQLYVPLQNPIPDCATYGQLENACEVAAEMDSTLINTTESWFLRDKSQIQLFNKACDELYEYNKKFKQAIFASLNKCAHEYGIASLLADSSAAAVELRGAELRQDILKDEYDLEDAYTYGPHAFILWHWLRLVAKGVPAADRRRWTMKMAGATLISKNAESTFPQETAEIVAALQHVNKLVLQLEEELVVAAAADSKTFLVVDEVTIFNEVRQVLAQKYTLRKEGEIHLLAVPEHILHVFKDWENFSLWTLMPVDDKVLEVAVKMWDSNPMSVLFPPVNLVAMAETVV